MIGGRINLKHLRAFRAVANHAHFTRAADAIGVSQPALSALIAQLEEDLDVTLLNRTTRAVELTPVGREFLSACSRVLAEVEGAILEAQDYAGLRKGRLRIAALPSLTRTLLPETLRIFRERHESIVVSVVDLPGDPLLEQVASGQVDLGIGYAEPNALLDFTPLLTDRLVAVLPEGSEYDERSELSWQDLARHDVIAMDHGTTVRRVMDEGARGADVTLRIVLEPLQMPTAIAYARAGLGIAVLPSTAIAPGQEPGMRSLTITGPKVERSLSVLTRRHQALTPAAEAFRTLLSDYVSGRCQELCSRSV
ncbi:LysR family transcriptional regulator [Sphingosinithalassobacter portus]|uniref:LysR family transcriptional regulator n=1 Tax=Stakelama portus TaxID=2676234 RepID=UPI000D6E4815|nr:LysR family transcriptional regulator [Sphingosinithalassobacter portus]